MAIVSDKLFLSFSRIQKSTVGHIAENCSSEQRLCYNCRQPGHESSACPSPRSVSAKQCYSCGGVGHIQAECPSLRIQNGGNQKCYVSTYVAFFLTPAHAVGTELWSIWPYRTYLSQCRWKPRNRLCKSRTSPWTYSQYVYFACTRQMLSLWRPQPYG